MSYVQYGLNWLENGLKKYFQYDTLKTMRLFYVLPLFCFISCTPQNNFIAEYVNIIGQNVSDTYTFENGNEYIRLNTGSKESPEIFMKLIADNNAIVQSCFITFSFSDSVEARRYYKQLYTYLRKENWQYIENISKYKKHGEIYLKNGVYFSIYEPARAISVELSNGIENIYKDSFYEK
ncbi:hypothetical protein AGMMS50293_02080 [Spirochaetia bacterium]|nr:hypothetical protein AGMMS50293_02080 [Spirochaetia bacterium]